MKYIQIKLKPGKEESLRRFHPWVFSGAIHSMTAQPEEGDVVEVCDNHGQFIALGHYQMGSIMGREFLPLNAKKSTSHFTRNVCGPPTTFGKAWVSSTRNTTTPTVSYTARATTCRA